MKQTLILIMTILPFAAFAGGGGKVQSVNGSFEGFSASDAGASAYIDASQGSVYGSDLGDRVPDAIAPSYPTSHTCALGVGGGAAVSGFGISVGGHYTDEDCVLRLDAVTAAKLGQPDTARELMCTKYAYYAANKRSNDPEPNKCAPNPKYDQRIAKDASDVGGPEEVANADPTAGYSEDPFWFQNQD